jgi:hypothetical protein
MAQAVNRRGSRPMQSVWYLWWTKCHWDKFSSDSFGFSVSVSFYLCFIFCHVSCGRCTKGPLAVHFHEDIHRETRYLNLPSALSPSPTSCPLSADAANLCARMKLEVRSGRTAYVSQPCLLCLLLLLIAVGCVKT